MSVKSIDYTLNCNPYNSSLDNAGEAVCNVGRLGKEEALRLYQKVVDFLKSPKIKNELKLLPYEAAAALAGGYAGTQIGKDISRINRVTLQQVLTKGGSQDLQDLVYSTLGSIILAGLAVGNYRLLIKKHNKSLENISQN